MKRRQLLPGSSLPHVDRRRRPRTRQELTAALDHLLVSPGGQGPGLIDRLLEQHGLTRRVALRIPHFYSALGILAKSDLILTAPSSLAQVARSDHNVTAFAPPLRVPGHSINMLWHERFTLDPGHAWLRDVLAESARATQSGTAAKRGR